MKTKVYVNKDSNTEPCYMENFFKLNDTVIVKDGSYMLDNKLNRVRGIDFHNGDKYELLQIIGINKPYPTGNKIMKCLVPINNCKIKGYDGKIYYCSNLNLIRFSK